MEEKKVFTEVEKKMQQTIEAMRHEFSTIRTNRASAGLVDEISVEAYDTHMPLKQLANIGIPDPRTILIQPWDPSIIVNLEKSLLKSNLGITPSNDGKHIRLTLPPLSHERRQQLAKLVEKIAEEGKVSIRNTRRVANEQLQKLQKDKLLSEDERYKAQDKAQKLTDSYIKKLDEMVKHKEKEILEI